MIGRPDSTVDMSCVCVVLLSMYLALRLLTRLLREARRGRGTRQPAR